MGVVGTLAPQGLAVVLAVVGESFAGPYDVDGYEFGYPVVAADPFACHGEFETVDNELLGFCPALGSVGPEEVDAVAGLYFGASASAELLGFRCIQANMLLPLVQPLAPIETSTTTAIRPIVARMA